MHAVHKNNQDPHLCLAVIFCVLLFFQGHTKTILCQLCIVVTGTSIRLYIHLMWHTYCKNDSAGGKSVTQNPHGPTDYTETLSSCKTTVLCKTLVCHYTWWSCNHVKEKTLQTIAFSIVIIIFLLPLRKLSILSVKIIIIIQHWHLELGFLFLKFELHVVMVNLA